MNNILAMMEDVAMVTYKNIDVSDESVMTTRGGGAGVCNNDDHHPCCPSKLLTILIKISYGSFD
jgi:hypothetical protein